MPTNQEEFVKDLFKLRGKRRHLITASGLTAVVLQLGGLFTPAQAGPSSTTTTSTTAPAPASVDEGLNTEPPDYTNWVTLGAGDVFVNGNKGEYQHEHDTNKGPFGGVEAFHWQTFPTKDLTFTMDGRGMFGNHDYDLKLDLTDEKVGYIRAGWTEYRTWYSPSGGFDPVNGLQFQPKVNDLFIDRRSAWIEAGLTLPDLPSFSFRYEYDSRKGLMDSTEWGDSGAAPAPDVKIVPAFLSIDETRNIFEGKAADKVGNTDVGMSLRYELDQTNDTTFINQDPLSPPGPAGNSFITDADIERNDIFNVNGFTETFLNDKVIFSSGLSYSNTGTNLGGSRIYGTAYGVSTPGFSNTTNRTPGYTNLSGVGNSNEYTGNFNLMLKPMKDLAIVGAVRYEYDSSDINDDSLLTGTTPSTSTPPSANSTTWTSSVAESVEARYTGLRDWSLYTGVETSQDWGNDNWNEPLTAVIDTAILNQNYERLGVKYTVGANWYPLPQLNFGGQYYHEIHDYNYTNNLNPPAATAAAYPGYLRKQNFTTDDGNIRATWQALSNVSLVTRYDFQFSTVDTWGVPSPGTQVGGVESSTYINHILGEDVNWTPLPCLYLQVGGSYVLNTLETPVAGSVGVNNVIENGQNNYWTLDASIGYEINAKTHLQVDYNYYNADNYFVNNSTADSIPYGAGEVEDSVTATVTREINKQVKVSVKYGYYTYTDAVSGGQDDYTAQLVYVSTTFGF